MPAPACSRDEESKAAPIPTREYATAELRLRVALAADFSVTGTYNYRWQEYEDELSDRSANGFLIGIVYEPKRDR